MKTYELIKLAKGYYVRSYYNSRTISNEYFSTMTAANAAIKKLKSNGFKEMI